MDILSIGVFWDVTGCAFRLVCVKMTHTQASMIRYEKVPFRKPEDWNSSNLP
jgi:hypothetical protein